MEIWKPIKHYEGYYEISNQGRVRKLTKRNGELLDTPTIRKPILYKNGYYRLGLYHLKSEKYNKKIWSIHRLVGEAFIANPANKETINHINGIKTDNRAQNLEWNTYSENIKHGFEIGLQYNSNKKPLKCSNGIIFKSSYEAARWINETVFNNSRNVRRLANSIRIQVNRGYKAYGYYFKFTSSETI